MKPALNTDRVRELFEELAQMVLTDEERAKVREIKARPGRKAQHPGRIK